jgi:hypothetical protein
MISFFLQKKKVTFIDSSAYLGLTGCYRISGGLPFHCYASGTQGTVSGRSDRRLRNAATAASKKLFNET